MGKIGSTRFLDVYYEVFGNPTRIVVSVETLINYEKDSYSLLVETVLVPDLYDKKIEWYCQTIKDKGFFIAWTRTKRLGGCDSDLSSVEKEEIGKVEFHEKRSEAFKYHEELCKKLAEEH